MRVEWRLLVDGVLYDLGKTLTLEIFPEFCA